MSTYNRTLWGGRRQDEQDTLRTLLPTHGPVPFNPRNLELEVFRQFSNAYYDIYNNGGGNWNVRGVMYRFACKNHGMRIMSVRDMIFDIDYKGCCQPLETLGDMVINAALKEQFG